MSGRRLSALSLFLCVALVTEVASQQASPLLPHFSTDTVYAYSFQSATQITNDVSVTLNAKLLVSVCDGENDEHQELHLNVTEAELRWSTDNNSLIAEENLSHLTSWFSALWERDGIISDVFYQSGDSHRVLALKKSLAGLFSVDVTSTRWLDDGVSVVVIQEGVSNTPAVGTRATKTTTIDKVNRVITEVRTDEQMDRETGPLLGQGVVSHSILTLLTHYPSPSRHHRPSDLISDDLTITSLERSQAPQESISSLLACAANNHECVRKLGEAIQLLNNDDVTILRQHLDENSDDFSLSQALSLLTAVSTSSPSPSTTHILTSLLLPSPPHPLPNEELVSKFFFHLTVSLPVDKFTVDQVWLVVNDHDNVSPALKSQALLALGAMARRVRPSHQDLATQIVAELHHLLEQHTGYSVPLTLHKHRRSTVPNLPSSLSHSSLHALLLDCLANAGADESFSSLAHHMTFGDLSVRHAAIRAMRGYDTEESAEVLLPIAEPSSSDAYHTSLTRAARSIYQTHPRRKRELSDISYYQPRNIKSRLARDSTNNDDVTMNVTMPTVGWNRQFGDSNISADLSRTVSNSFTLDTTDQSSQYHFSFHDEMTMTSHLALASDPESDFEMMRTQLCLEGTASFDTVNILTELTPEKTYQQYLKYREASTLLVEDFEAAYDLLVSSNSVYDGIRDALITELDNLINVHFEDVMTKLNDALPRLDALSSNFYLKDIAFEIHSAFETVLTSNRASATTARMAILSDLEDNIPSKPEDLYEALLVDGQPFTTHSFHVPYLPFAPQKALVNIFNVYRRTEDAYDELENAVQMIIDMTSSYGPNHPWLSPPLREISDNLATLTADIIQAINEMPLQGSDGPQLQELNELYDIVNSDLGDLLDALMGVANDVIAQSVELSAALEGSRKAFTTFTLSYYSARSTVDTILGQKFHPLFPRQRRSCDHARGCGSFPTTSDQSYGEGVALVMSDREQVVAPLSGYYSLSAVSAPYDSSTTITLTPAEASYHGLTFTLTHILPSVELTDSPIFIPGGAPLGILNPEPLSQDTDDEYYIHIEAHKTVGNETYTIDQTQFLHPISDPQVLLRYDCNDLVTYIGSTVVDRRQLAPESPTAVEYGAELVADGIPDHEFPQPVDHVLQAQGTILSGTSVEVFSSSTSVTVGTIPVQLDFHAVGDYELEYSIDVSLFSGQSVVSLTPSLISLASGYMRTEGIVYATVSLEGSVVESSLPLTLWQNFLEWPLTASSQMDLVLSPSSLSLTSQLAQTTGAGDFTSEEILQSDTLWYYEIPPLNRDEFYYRGTLVDESPPDFKILPYADTDCYVRQLAVGDFYTPMFEIEFVVSEPQGLLSTAYKIGSAPKTDDIIGNSEVAGSRIVVPQQLIAASPIHVTVTATNRNGYETLATCSMQSYDRSPPLARITPVRPVSSHPSKISVLFSLFDEFGLDTPLQVAIGTVPGDYGNDVMDWTNFDLSTITTPPTDSEDVLDHFSFKRVGRLLTEVHSVTHHMATPSECARECFMSSVCRSFDHSPLEANCILHSGIEGLLSPSSVENVFQTPPLQPTNDYGHYERLGVGNSSVMEFTGLPLRNNMQYYVNMRLVNGLGFTSTASSTPFLVDLTPPSPGNLHSVTSDDLVAALCEELSIGGLECLDSANESNLRVIVDGPDSALVFNGLVPLRDAMYTSANNYITANWQGMEDHQSGIHAYRWWVGSELGRDDIMSPTDPHIHLIGGQSAWTNTGLVTGLDLSDGSYYISVQAINGIEYGGPLATTIYHSTAYVLDTSPPELNDVIINNYNISTNQLAFSYDAIDDQSGLHSVSLSLGRTEHDTAILSWTGVETSGNGMVTVDIPDGVDTWVKLRATNNAGLSSIAVAEMAIRIDRSPPLTGPIGDGDNVIRGDIDSQREADMLCIHGTGITDPQSGISAILWVAGTSRGARDIISGEDVTDPLLVSGYACVTGLSLIDNTTYYSTLYITNRAITSLTTTVMTDGVLVDTTGPSGGRVYTDTVTSQGGMYSSDITDVAVYWEGFYDYESGITEYRVRVHHQPADSDEYDEIHTETVDGSVSELTWTHFSFGDGDRIFVEVIAENGAGRRTTQSSDPYIIDLSPPHVRYLVDGVEEGQDVSHQSCTDTLSVSWSAEDAESQIETVEISVWKQFEGRRMLIYPDPLLSGQTNIWIDPSLSSYTVRNLTLTHGVKYIAVLTLTNGAGLISEYESSGVVIDTSPPLVTAVSVDGDVIINQEEEGSVEYVVPNTDRVSVRWSSHDVQSGVSEVLVGIVDENDTLVSPEMVSYPGFSSAGVVENLSLTAGSRYRVAVITVNHAQSQSMTTYSKEFSVVSDEVAGRVFDGEDPAPIDADYTDEATAVTVHFEGFSTTRCGGVLRYEWAVGEGWQEELQQTVMKFTERGMVANENTGSGYAQALLPGLAGYGPLFVTVRGTTDCDDVILSTSNGFVIDPSPPSLEILGTGENAIEHAQSNSEGVPINHTTYQTTPSFSSLWRLNDDQSGIADTGVVRIGTYPGGSDVQDETTTPDDSIRGRLQGGEGVPHFVTVTGTNRAGLSTTAWSRAVVLDTSPPTLGQQDCVLYGFPSPLPLAPNSPSLVSMVIVCEWSGIEDPQSGIAEYTVVVTNEDEAIYKTTIPGVETGFEMPSLDLNDTLTYLVSVTPTNRAGLSRTIFSEVSLSDSSAGYRVPVKVVVNYGRTENTSGMLGEVGRVESREDFVCLLETDFISIEFSAPLSTQAVDMDSFEVGVGYSPGSDNHHIFTSFTPSLITSDTYSHTLTSITILTIGRRPIYITVQARSLKNNRLIFKSTTPPIYIKSSITQWDSWLVDGTDPNNDVEFQTSTTEISASFSIGSHCPLTSARWSVEDASGTTVQDYIDVEIPAHSGVDVQNTFTVTTDQVRLFNEESYRVLVQAVDFTGEIFVLRSNGLTVTTDDLVPSTIQDGPIPDEDLNYQEPTDYLSAYWTGFGDGTPQQEILYYEVAAGSNMGYPNTRSNIAPFTNIGLKTDHTFTNLDLIPESVEYFITVRATAVSGAIVMATSNGIRVGLGHTISPGDIILSPYSSSASEIEVYWNEFESNVPIRSYEWAVGVASLNETLLLDMCTDYLSRFENTFEISPFTNVGLSTSAFLSGLNLTDNTTYYVAIRATDEANKCLTVTSSGMLVDLSDPISPPQRVVLGPSESRIGLDEPSGHVVFVQPGGDLSVWWNEFVDLESGIDHYEVALFQQTECGYSNNSLRVTDYVNTGLVQSFTFEDPVLSQDAAYVVEISATNGAGLRGSVFSEPILLDWNEALPGVVKDGLDWENDVVFQSDLSTLSGVFSHAKIPPRNPGVVLQNDPCPNTTFHSLTSDDGTWHILVPDTITGIDPTTIEYDAMQANLSSNGLRIIAERDESVNILTGAYQTEVDMSLQTAVVSLDIRAALGADEGDEELEAQSITSVVFVDSHSENILADFEFERRDSQYPSSPDTSAIGLQIQHSTVETEQRVILWSKSRTQLGPVTYITHDIPNLNLSIVHTYTLDFRTEELDTSSSRWADLYIDGQLVTTLHGITELSNTSRMVLHVFNRNGFVPTEFPDIADPPRVEAVFANVSLPRLRSHVCDYGQPFFSASSPIVQFSVGVGTSPGLTDVAELQMLSMPCRPCLPGLCPSYGCNNSCTAIDPYTLNFTISNLTLSPGYHTNQSDASSGYFEFESSNSANTLVSIFSNYIQPAVYYVTVEAITSSGQYITASSNGVTMDTTPPEQIAPVDHFDVTFSLVQPTDFQASNDTIAVRWTLRDFQSGIVDNKWGIGTAPYRTDIQPLTSVGRAQNATNGNLIGIIQDNVTYYVTVVATNGAGLSASVVSDGVTYSTTVLNFTALEEVVEIEFVRSVDVRGVPGEEVLVVEQEDRAAIMWDGISDDVEDVFWYIGTSPSLDNVLPKTEVSFNSSRRAEFEGGILYLEGARFADISEITAQVDGEREGEDYFVLEPGRLVYNTLEMCNFVHRCVTVETAPSILIRLMDGEVTAEMEGTDVEVTVTQTQGQSTEVTDRDYTLTLTTSGGVATGTILVTGFLTHTDLHQTYHATPPYISNPFTTMTQTSLQIARRFAVVAGPSFYVSFLGQDTLNGPLTINATFDPLLARDAYILDIFYWDSYDEIWREVNATCGTTSLVDWTTFTISANVCSTVVGSVRQRRQTDMSGSGGSGSGSLGSGGSGNVGSGGGTSGDDGDVQEYLSGPVQFIVVGIGNTSANTAPQLQLPTEPLSVLEKGALSNYQLLYTDMEGDEVEFYIASPPRLGTASLTLDGVFSYTPCTHCTGVDSFEILIVEKPFGFNNDPLTAGGVLVVEIENQNDPPLLYAFDPLSESGRDVTEEVELNVYIESNRSSPVSVSHVVAVDVDGYFDDLTISTQDGDFGQANAEIWLDVVSVLESLPVTSLPGDTFLGYVAFLAANITYMADSDFVGRDVVRVRIRDTTGALSNTLTINIDVIPSWCVNDGVCNGSTSDPNCTDILARRNSPGSYGCSCVEGYSGRYCEIDTMIIDPAPLRDCPDGIPEMRCEGDPCANAVCPSNNAAVCRPNYCGGCIAEWFVGDTQIQCNIDDPIVCLKPTDLACVINGVTSCDCPKQPYPCPQDSVFVETRHSDCCVSFECRCPESSCPLLMESDLNVQPVPVYRGNRFPGRCCPLYGFEDIDECGKDSSNVCSDVCINQDRGYSCDCPTGQTLSLDGQNCGVCKYKGREYLHGDRVKIGCNWCVCGSDTLSGERWQCTAASCPASCVHSGVEYQVHESLSLPLDRVTCVCETTDSYADWRCNYL